MNSETLFLVLIAFGIVNLIALAIFLIFRFQYNASREKMDHFGDHAEHLVQTYIHDHFPDAFLLNNLYFKTDYGLTQIDHILICQYGLYIIETKSHNGQIMVGERNWTQHYKDKNIQFHSPVRQNNVHLKALKRVLSADKAFSRYKIGTVVVFTSKNVTFSENVRGVIRLNRLKEYIKHNPQVKGYNDKQGGMKLSTRKKLKNLILESAEKSSRKQGKHRSDIRDQYSEQP